MCSLRGLLFILLVGIIGAPNPKARDSSIEAMVDALPSWYAIGSGETGHFDSKAFLVCAQQIQALPEVERLALLRRLAKGKAGIQVIVLCRLLFEAKPECTFRAPLLGWGGSAPRLDEKDWDLDPIALSEGIPFLIAPHYSAIQRKESPSDYLAYCETQCRLKSAPLQVPEDAVFLHAYESLCSIIGGTRKGTWMLYFRSQLPMAVVPSASHD